MQCRFIALFVLAMKKQQIGFVLPLLICVLTPLVATAEFTRTLYRVESTPFHPGDTVTFIASVRQVKDGANRGVSGETVTFSLSPDDGTAIVKHYKRDKRIAMDQHGRH